jgi:hypothetical protein
MTPEQYRLQCLLYVNGVASQRESARAMLLACGPAAIPWILNIAEETLKEFYKPGIGYPPFQSLIRYAKLLAEYGEPCCLDLLVRIAQQSPDQGYEEFRKPLKKLLTFLESRDDIETTTALVAALRRLRRAILYQREAVSVAEILVASAERAPRVELHQVRALLQPSIGTPKEFRILSERLTRALGEESFLPLSAASAPAPQSLPIPVRALEENDG